MRSVLDHQAADFSTSAVLIWRGPVSRRFLCRRSPGSLVPSRPVSCSKNVSQWSSQPGPAIRAGSMARMNSPPRGGPPSPLSLALASNENCSPSNPAQAVQPSWQWPTLYSRQTAAAATISNRCRIGGHLAVFIKPCTCGDSMAFTCGNLNFTHGHGCRRHIVAER